MNQRPKTAGNGHLNTAVGLRSQLPSATDLFPRSWEAQIQLLSLSPSEKREAIEVGG